MSTPPATSASDGGASGEALSSDAASAAPAPSTTAGKAPPEETAWVNIGHSTRFGARTTIKIHKRRVTVLRLPPGSKASWTVIDTICYHAGGPLTEGAFRTIAGRTCLQCPWHRYLVDVRSGEGLYLDLDRRYQSKGVRQRVHEVEERDGHLWIRLCLDGEVPSDSYAYGPRFKGREEDGENVPEFPQSEELW